MAADPIYARIARLEGVYEQIDKRMASLEGLMRDLRAEVGVLRTELRSEFERRMDRVEGRVDLVLYGLAVAILLPILLRVFFH